METITKYITLNKLKCRHPSLIPHIGQDLDGKIVLNENGCWGQIPYDIDIVKCFGFKDLKIYFGCDETAQKARVSFYDILNKWYLFKDIFKTTVYWKKILKNGNYIWVKYEPTFRERITINVISEDKYELSINSESEEDYIGGDTIIGVYVNDDFNDNGGNKMLNFIMKAIGMFCVDEQYITSDNYVPEILYYTDVLTWQKKLKALKASDDCCVENEYELYGGDAFLTYLGVKANEMLYEANYWKDALYLEYDNKKGDYQPTASNLVIDVVLTTDFNPIGTFTVVEPTTLDVNSRATYINSNDYNYLVAQNETDGELFSMGNDLSAINDVYDIYDIYDTDDIGGYKITTESRLHELKRDKKTYCYNKKTQQEEEMDVILVETTNSKFKFEPRYVINSPKNTKYIDGSWYGDVIYSIDSVPDKNGYIEIKYVFGGKLTNKKTYDINSRTGVLYREKVRCEVKNFIQETNLEIKQLNNLGREVNILTSMNIENISNVRVIYDSDNIEVVGTFFMDYPEDITDYKIIMLDYNVKKTEQLVENIDEITIDRGYASAFELHYKIGEINTFEDLQNYQNNIFGL